MAVYTYVAKDTTGNELRCVRAETFMFKTAEGRIASSFGVMPHNEPSDYFKVLA